MKKFYLFLILPLILLAIGCKKESEANVEGVFAGGATTVFDETSNAYTFPSNNLSQVDADKHIDADAIFEQKFVTGEIFNKDFDGLGPQFNHVSCSGCHLRNGRAAPPENLNEPSGLLIRLSIDGIDDYGGPLAVPGFGGQLQNFSDLANQKEADLFITYLPIQEIFPDQKVVTLSKPFYKLLNSYTSLPANLKTSPRIASIIPGLGLLEALTEETILEYVDEFDKNKDGISGRANYGWSVEYGKKMIGRFGWKAATVSLKEQAAAALNQDMGLTNSIFPEENCKGQSNCVDDGVKDISLEQLEQFTFYCQTVGVPAARNQGDSMVQRGKRLFSQIGCDKCHRPSMKTGIHPSIQALSNQVIFPYTDMLLHDMGEDLADNRPDFLATGKEWRTPPLWGIGLSQVVNNHIRLMHDGRANGFEEAILWHNGEGVTAKKAYKLLIKSERESLIKFLESL